MKIISPLERGLHKVGDWSDEMQTRRIQESHFPSAHLFPSHSYHGTNQACLSLRNVPFVPNLSNPSQETPLKVFSTLKPEWFFWKIWTCLKPLKDYNPSLDKDQNA